ncbi:MAG TPA: alpha/beta hydrolase [Gemmatimonadaceae bacterium]|nr:alpha/beta hydrolase [Gemmatimonadaceae bacterium]
MQADVLRVPVGPGAMHVERFGHGGTAVILIHGFATSSFLWRNIAPDITDAGHTAYAIDLFGHGESDRPLDSEFGIAAQAEYLDAAMTALRVARGIIVGVDIGGDVALRLAATRPERVEKLVLINTPAFDELPARDITQMQRSTAKFAFRTTRGILGAAPLVEGVLKGSVADPETHMPVKLIARYLAPFVGKDGVSHLLALASSISGEDMDDVDLGTIHVPALIVWGEKDQWVNSKIAERLASALPDGRLVRVSAAGRLIPEESPERLSELLLDFMRRRAVA